MRPLLPAGVILAGGRARRMGGGDKALLLLGGQSLLSRVADRLRPQVAALALSANGDPRRFDGFGLPVLPDDGEAGEGPLAGVLAGLDWAASHGHRAIATAAADTPFLPLDLVAALCRAGGSGMAVASTAAGLHPTFGLWPVTSREALRAFLAAGGRRAADFARAGGAARAPFPDVPVDPFFNINTPADLEAAAALL